MFCDFIERSPEQIVREYEDSTHSTERQMMRKYAAVYSSIYVYAVQEELIILHNSIKMAPILSFFKYNDLPLGHVSIPQMRVTYHNRDITHEEVKMILDASKPRERAFYAIMAQSGLRPETICNLRYENVKEDLSKGIIPCKIEVPQDITKGKYRSYFTFIGEEAVHYLQSYLYVRRHVTDEDYLFVKEGTEERTDPKSLSNIFGRTVNKLQEKGLIEVKQKQKGKPRNIRLYNLRKWFRKHAHEAGFELVQFWMGHTVHASQEERYRPTDVEFHRELYAEKAMPFLRLEKATPTETEKTIAELKKLVEEKDKEMSAMKETIVKIQPLVEFVNSFRAPKDLKAFLDGLRDDYMIQLAEDPKIEVDQSVFKMISEVAAQKEAFGQIVRGEYKQLLKGEEARRKRAKAHGVPMTKKEYEQRKAERDKARVTQ
jgi:integrase